MNATDATALRPYRFNCACETCEYGHWDAGDPSVGEPSYWDCDAPELPPEAELSEPKTPEDCSGYIPDEGYCCAACGATGDDGMFFEKRDMHPYGGLRGLELCCSNNCVAVLEKRDDDYYHNCNTGEDYE